MANGDEQKSATHVASGLFGLELNRKEFLKLFLLLAATGPSQSFAAAGSHPLSGRRPSYPRSVQLLQNAFVLEIIAHLHYVGYASEALKEDFPNIAYLFTAFSVSEKIHAVNFGRVLHELGGSVPTCHPPLTIFDTKKNLRRAAEKEIKKIKETYPRILARLREEPYRPAILTCEYSWKSHCQHREKIEDIRRYSGWFFSALAKKIEGMDEEFYVCTACGSTVTRRPENRCVICGSSPEHSCLVERPRA